MTIMKSDHTTAENPPTAIEHVEEQTIEVLKPSELVAEAAAKGQATTGYENLTAWQTVKTFKVATAVCFAAALSAAADGFQIG